MEKHHYFLFISIFVFIYLPTVKSQDHSNWNINSNGTGWQINIEERNNEFELLKTYHSSKSLHIGKNGSRPGQYATLTKTFNIDSILALNDFQIDSLYISFWQRDSYSNPLVSNHFRKQININNINYFDQQVGTSSWQHIVLNVTNLKNLPSITVNINLYTISSSSLTIDTYWDNIAVYYDNVSNRKYRTNQLKGTKATYAGVEDLENRWFDNPSEIDPIISDLLQELVYANVNTYDFLIWHDTPPNHIRWDILTDNLLPKLDSIGVNVWATIEPPISSEFWYQSMPYDTNYIVWAQEFAGLSLENPNLIAFKIDDFDANNALNTFTPEYVNSMISYGSHTINPKLSFVTTNYYDLVSKFVVSDLGEPVVSQEGNEAYLNNIDAINFPFIFSTYEEYGTLYWSLFNTTKFYDQVNEIHQNLVSDEYGDNLPLILMIYSHAYIDRYAAKISTPEYVLELSQRALEKTDGINYYTQVMEWQNNIYGNYEMLNQKREIIRQVYSYWENQTSRTQRVLVMNNGHGLFYSSQPEKAHYLFCPDWFYDEQSFDFNNIQYILSGDYDADGLEEIAMFYDYPGTLSSTPQRIFVYPDINYLNKFLFKLRFGNQENNSWFSTDMYNNNFDFHQFGLAGDFDANGKDEIAVFYDYPGDSVSTPQRAFVYGKAQDEDKFEQIWGPYTFGAWFESDIYNFNFDLIRDGVAGDFNGDGRDELMFFYDYEGSDPNTPQRVFLIRSQIVKVNLKYGGDLMQ